MCQVADFIMLFKIKRHERSFYNRGKNDDNTRRSIWFETVSDALHVLIYVEVIWRTFIYEKMDIAAFF